jgi:hypothetical protein
MIARIYDKKSMKHGFIGYKFVSNRDGLHWRWLRQ